MNWSCLFPNLPQELIIKYIENKIKMLDKTWNDLNLFNLKKFQYIDKDFNIQNPVSKFTSSLDTWCEKIICRLLY